METGSIPRADIEDEMDTAFIQGLIWEKEPKLSLSSAKLDNEIGTGYLVLVWHMKWKLHARTYPFICPFM